MRKGKIHHTIEYLKTLSFSQDVMDLNENFIEILTSYGITDSFSNAELHILKKDLYHIAANNQTREIEYLINRQQGC